MQKNDDEQRTVTTTVARLKRFEAAVRRREESVTAMCRAKDARDLAEEKWKRSQQDESDARDEVVAATKALYEDVVP